MLSGFGIFLELARFAILITICIFLYRGLLWARAWLLISLIAAFLLDVILTISTIGSLNLIGTIIMATFAMLHGGIAAILLFSASIREFLNSQLNSTDEAE